MTLLGFERDWYGSAGRYLIISFAAIDKLMARWIVRWIEVLFLYRRGELGLVNRSLNSTSVKRVMQDTKKRRNADRACYGIRSLYKRCSLPYLYRTSLSYLTPFPASFPLKPQQRKQSRHHPSPRLYPSHHFFLRD